MKKHILLSLLALLLAGSSALAQTRYFIRAGNTNLFLQTKEGGYAELQERNNASDEVWVFSTQPAPGAPGYVNLIATSQRGQRYMMGRVSDGRFYGTFRMDSGDDIAYQWRLKNSKIPGTNSTGYTLHWRKDETYCLYRSQDRAGITLQVVKQTPQSQNTGRFHWLLINAPRARAATPATTNTTRNTTRNNTNTNRNNNASTSSPSQNGWTVMGNGFFRIQNRWKPNEHIHVERHRPESSGIDMGWWSAQWVIEFRREGNNNLVRIRNRWKPNQYLHIENGPLAIGAIQDGWWSAQWIMQATPANGQQYVRLQNRWKPNLYLHIENGSLVAGPIDGGWWSAQWLIKQAN